MCGIHFIDTVDKSRKTYERNGVQTIVDKNGILYLNEKNIEDRLDYKNLQDTTAKISIRL